MVDRQEDLRRSTVLGGLRTGQSHAQSGSPAVELINVSKTFRPSKAPARMVIEKLTLAVPRGEFLSIVGPSGCVKSTLLGLIAGLERIDDGPGSISVLGERQKGIPRQLGYMFQSDALLPWRTVLQNVALPLRFRGRKKSEAYETARAWLSRVGLSDFRDHYPHQISGGMKKRVALAATLSYEPSVLLMDEPFGALDVQTRTLMENDLLALWDSAKPTVIFITHDLEEAVGLSDRVIVMAATRGRIVGDFHIPLSRPRDLLELRFDGEFVKIHRQLWHMLRSEVREALGSDAEVDPNG
jgi:NitT/TauT family transport system ATP-binding protein